MLKNQGTVPFEPRILKKDEIDKLLEKYYEHLNAHPVEILHLCHTRNELITFLRKLELDCCSEQLIGVARIIGEYLEQHGEE